MSLNLMHPAAHEILNNAQVMRELQDTLQYGLRDLKADDRMGFDLNRITSFSIPDSLPRRVTMITEAFTRIIADHLASSLQSKADEAAREKIKTNLNRIVGAVLS